MNTIDEAIELLKEIVNDDEEDGNLDAAMAERLGIEALKAIVLLREDPRFGVPVCLPGETI